LHDLKARALSVSKFEVRRFIHHQNTGGKLLETICGYTRPTRSSKTEAKEQRRQLYLSATDLMEEWEDTLNHSGLQRNHPPVHTPDAPKVRTLDELGKTISLPINMDRLTNKSVVIRYPGVHNVLFKSPYIQDLKADLHVRRLPHKPKEEKAPSWGHGGVGLGRRVASSSDDDKKVYRPPSGYIAHTNWNQVSKSHVWNQ